jgi:hypothetical protein
MPETKAAGGGVWGWRDLRKTASRIQEIAEK